MKKKSITGRIQTVEDARKETGRPVVDFSNVPEDLKKYFESVYDAVVVTEALNKGHKPNWDDSSERKWRPWFYMSPSSFGFHDANCAYSSAYAGCGSRLCNKTEALAEYSAKQFKETWKGVQLD